MVFIPSDGSILLLVFQLDTQCICTFSSVVQVLKHFHFF